MNESTAYQSGIAYTYDQIITDICGGDLNIYKNIIQQLLSQTSFNEKDKILELACGTGIASQLLLQQPCQELYCVDNSWNMLEMAEYRLSNYYVQWKFMQERWIKDYESADEKLRLQGIYEPLQQIPKVKLIYHDINLIDQPQLQYLENSKVNKIIMTNALLSISNIDQLFQAIYNRLEPSGEFLFNVKLKEEDNGKPLNYKLLREMSNKVIQETIKEKVGQISGYTDHTDIAPYYTKADIIQLTKRNGFKIINDLEESIYLSNQQAQHYFNAAINRYNKAFDNKFNGFQFNKKLRDNFETFVNTNSLTNFLLRNEGYFLLKKN